MRFLLAAMLAATPLGALPSPAVAQDALPFQQKVEVYRNEEGDISVFALRLEQPFLAEEFEKSNYLRLQSDDPRAYLIYPKQTKFQQKHAEFYGRLRGEGKVTLTLTYETVTENLDGTRKVEVRRGPIEVPIPAEQTGPRSIFLDWARRQNDYFAELLRYYPEESFYQYCLLQSKARYGVDPPPLAKAMPREEDLETDLYQVFTGSLAIQESLQRQTLSPGAGPGDLDVHISTLQPPDIRSLDYKDLLEKKREEEGVEPTVHDLSRLVPEDQYLLHFNSMRAAGELFDLWLDWGEGILRLFTIRGHDPRVQGKIEQQLCISRDGLSRLFADGAVDEFAVTGGDPFLLEGTDLTFIFHLNQPEPFRKAAAAWLADVRAKHPGIVDREFNYRGHKVQVYYTKDRVVSAFIVEHEEYAIYANSHRSIRRVIDTAAGLSPSLHAALDYRYVSTILPSSEAENTGYFFVPEAMIRRLVGPAAKISEKRRLQCANNLVMLNNASLFYRLEYDTSPSSLSDLIEGNFVDPEKIVCPHGGAYAFDVEHDTCTCALHNRLKYLTPNAELTVLNVSRQEAAQYDRYKGRYAEFWKGFFGPIAMRITVDGRVKVESCVLPLANGSLYRELRSMLAKNPAAIPTARFAPSAVASVVMVPGREHVAEFLQAVPGLTEVLQANPTLTDMSWVGDRLGLHFCDGETILEIDPTKLRPMDVPFMGRASMGQQMLIAALVSAVNVPVYVTVDVEKPEAAARLLEELSQEVFLKGGDVGNMATSLDAYRLPDYKGHALYVFSGQIYAVKLRLHVALVDNQLVAATKPEILRQVIDAASTKQPASPVEAHMLLRLNRRGLGRLYDDVQRYWSEKSRLACHRNISSIYNLCKLYGIGVDEVPRLAEAKYGVRFFCPEDGTYEFLRDEDQVVCTVHGNRQQSRQSPSPDGKSSFDEFAKSLDEVVAALRFRDDALIATVEIVRSTPEKKPE